jgi:hypothetical protein
MEDQMKILVKVDTPAVGSEPGATYHLAKEFEFDPAHAPIPVAGDELYLDGVFMTVNKRCITMRSKYAPRESTEDVELFASVDMRTFEELENIEGWRQE